MLPCVSCIAGRRAGEMKIILCLKYSIQINRPVYSQPPRTDVKRNLRSVFKGYTYLAGVNICSFYQGFLNRTK